MGAVFAGEAPEDPIAAVFDFSLLKFKEKDELMDCFRSWSRCVPFDMEVARQGRPDGARDVIQRSLNPRLLMKMASCDAATVCGGPYYAGPTEPKVL